MLDTKRVDGVVKKSVGDRRAVVRAPELRAHTEAYTSASEVCVVGTEVCLRFLV